MSNFKFKLQKLLDIRVNEEEESKLFYSKAQNQKNIVENKLHELENNYKKYSDISRAKDTISQKITMNYLSYLNTTIKDTEKELEAKEIELEKAKKDFIDKRIKRRSLEVLKENKILEIKTIEELVSILKIDFPNITTQTCKPQKQNTICVALLTKEGEPQPPFHFIKQYDFGLTATTMDFPEKDTVLYDDYDQNGVSLDDPLAKVFSTLERTE